MKVGLIISGHAYVHPSGKAHAGMSGIYDDALIPAWKSVVDATHEAGGLLAIQINHGGRQCDPAVVEGRMLAPSPISSRTGSTRSIGAGASSSCRPP